MRLINSGTSAEMPFQLFSSLFRRHNFQFQATVERWTEGYFSLCFPPCFPPSESALAFRHPSEGTFFVNQQENVNKSEKIVFSRSDGQVSDKNMVIQARVAVPGESTNGDDSEVNETQATLKSVRIHEPFVRKAFSTPNSSILENWVCYQRSQRVEEAEATVNAVFRIRFLGNSLRKSSIFLQWKDSNSFERLCSDFLWASHQKHQR